MNSLIFTAWVLVIAVFHRMMSRCMRQGRMKTGFCAVWCIDAIFAICGTVISFVLYGYQFQPFLTVRNVILVVLYLLLTLLFVLVTPSGIALIGKKRNLSEEQISIAEYRLNETLGIVRNCFLTLLFCIPIVFIFVQKYEGFEYLASWRENQICGGFCFVAFLILVPISLRQSVYWLRNLWDKEQKGEALLKKYRKQLQYRHKNRML